MRNDLIELANKTLAMDQTSDEFYSKENFMLNIHSLLFKVYDAPKFSFLENKEKKWCELLFHVLSYTARIGATKIETLEHYTHAVKGSKSAIMDLSHCIIGAYGLKMNVGFCQDIIGYIECHCKSEGYDIWKTYKRMYFNKGVAKVQSIRDQIQG